MLRQEPVGDGPERIERSPVEGGDPPEVKVLFRHRIEHLRKRYDRAVEGVVADHGLIIRKKLLPADAKKSFLVGRDIVSDIRPHENFIGNPAELLHSLFIDVPVYDNEDAARDLTHSFKKATYVISHDALVIVEYIHRIAICASASKNHVSPSF